MLPTSSADILPDIWPEAGSVGPLDRVVEVDDLLDVGGLLQDVPELGQ